MTLYPRHQVGEGPHWADVCLTRSVVSVLRDIRPIVSVLLSAECDGDGVGEPRKFLVVGGYRVPVFSKPHVVNRDHCGDSSSPGVGILARPHREEEGRHYQLSDGFVSCCRPHCSYSPDHFQVEGLLRSRVEVFVRIPFQLQCQNWFKTPCGVVDGALKFVKPEGQSHTVEGGTNSAGLSSMARSLTLSGTQPLSPKGGREAREDFDFLGSSESSEKRIEVLSDATEE